MLTLKVYALQATTGKILWERTSFEGPPYDDRHRSNTYASSTIATDGKLLYVSFEAAGFYAYDLAGALKWKLDLGNIAKGGLGPGTSPFIYGNLVILQCDQEMGEGSFIAAFDKTTGKEAWRVTRTTRRSWATPIVVTAGGRDELVTSGAEIGRRLRPEDRQGAVDRAGRGQPSDPELRDGEGARVGDGGQPGQDGAGAAAGPARERRRARRRGSTTRARRTSRRRSSTATTCTWSATPAS